MSTEELNGNWDKDFPDDDDKPQGGGGDFVKAEYVDMSSPGTYKVRLAGPHIVCRRHWSPIRATVKDDGKATDPAWQAGFVPGRRFAINVINKTNLGEGETGPIQVMEKGATVFKAFAAYKAATGIDPAGKDGPDFIITVKIPKGKDGQPNKMKTEYSVVPVAPTPFTAEEVAMLNKKEGGQGLWPLKELYKPTSAEELQELWDAVPEDKRIAPKKPWDDDSKDTASTPSASTTAPAEAPAPSTPEAVAESGDDSSDPADLF